MSTSRRAAQLGLVFSCIVLMLGMGVLLARSGTGTSRPSSDLGQRIPDARFFDLNGNVVRTSSLTGQAVVLFFSAAQPRIPQACAAALNRLQARYGEDGSVPVVAIRQDSDATGTDRLRELRVRAAVLGHTFRILIDLDARGIQQFGVEKSSTFMVLNDKGQIVQRLDVTSDASDETISETLSTTLESLVAKPQTAVAAR